MSANPHSPQQILPRERVALGAVLSRVADAVRRRRRKPLLVAISGIDGSGKSCLAKLLTRRLEGTGFRVALIGIDPWQNPQTIRFSSVEPARHFYRHAIRFEELFVQVVDPLVTHRSLNLETLGIRTDADTWEPLVYAHQDVDVVLLEGIFLFRCELVDRYDLRIWVECPFEAALRRALARNAERRSLEALRADYEQVYHSAQRLHIKLDDPRGSADLLFDNETDLARLEIES